MSVELLLTPNVVVVVAQVGLARCVEACRRDAEELHSGRAVDCRDHLLRLLHNVGDAADGGRDVLDLVRVRVREEH